MERQRPLQGEAFSDEEAGEVVRRAIELQQQANPAARIPREVLEDSAGAAGVAPEFVQQAIAELRANQAHQAAVRGSTRQRGARIRLTILAAALAAGISFLTALLSYKAPSRPAHPRLPPPVVRPMGIPKPPAPLPPAPPARR